MSDAATSSPDSARLPQQGSQIVFPPWIRGWMFHAVILACFSPLLLVHLRQLWFYEHYRYFPILLIAFALLLRRHIVRDGRPCIAVAGATWHWSLILLGLVLLLLAVAISSANMAALAWVVTAGATCWYFYQCNKLTCCFSCWLVLLFLVRLPLNLDHDLVFGLRGITAAGASSFLDLFGVNHYLAGHQLILPERAFLIDDAGSGSRILFTLLATTAVISTFLQRSKTQTFLLLAVATFWAYIVNVIRVVTVAMTSRGTEWQSGTDLPGSVSGIIVFAVALGLVASSDRLLLFFMSVDSSSGDDIEVDPYTTLDRSTAPPHPVVAVAESPGYRVALPGQKSNLLCWTVMTAFLSLALAQLSILLSEGGDSEFSTPYQMTSLFSEESLPQQIGAWTRTGFAMESKSITDYRGRHSARWTFHSESGEVEIYVDYPLWGWREQAVSCAAYGFTLEQWSRVDLNGKGLPLLVETTVSTPFGARAKVLSSQYSASGHWIRPPGNTVGLMERLGSRLRLASTGNKYSFAVQSRYYFVDSLDDNTVLELRALHTSVSKRVLDMVQVSAK